MSTVDRQTEYNREDYVTPPQVAQAWGVSRRSVQRMIQTGQLPALVLPSGRYLVHRKHLTLRSAP
jgi:predicted site-specific integrase-resolvase